MIETRSVIKPLMDDEDDRSGSEARLDTVVRRADLPVLQFRQQIQEAVAENDLVIVIGETGSGKTTQIPQILYEVMGPNDRLAVTQPRKFATQV